MNNESEPPNRASNYLDKIFGDAIQAGASTIELERVPDGLEEIGRAWNELEAVVALRGRHFYGAYDPVADDYRACVEVCESDDLVPGLEEGSLPGGRYLRARLRGDPPGLYERIKPTFDELMRQSKPDESRPSLEHYRRHDEIDLLLPI